MLCGPSLLPCFFYAQQRPVSPRGAGPSPDIGCYAAGGRHRWRRLPPGQAPWRCIILIYPPPPLPSGGRRGAAAWPAAGGVVARRPPMGRRLSLTVEKDGWWGGGGGGVPPSGRGRSMTCHARPDLSYYTAMHPSGRGWFRGYIDMAVGGGGGARQWFPSSADIGCAVNSSVPLLCLSLSDCFLIREAPASAMRGTLDSFGLRTRPSCLSSWDWAARGPHRRRRRADAAPWKRMTRARQTSDQRRS